jgi:hypothetical protein
MSIKRYHRAPTGWDRLDPAMRPRPMTRSRRSEHTRRPHWPGTSRAGRACGLPWPSVIHAQIVSFVTPSWRRCRRWTAKARPTVKPPVGSQRGPRRLTPAYWHQPVNRVPPVQGMSPWAVYQYRIGWIAIEDLAPLGELEPTRRASRHGKHRPRLRPAHPPALCLSGATFGIHNE